MNRFVVRKSATASSGLTETTSNTIADTSYAKADPVKKRSYVNRLL